MVAFNPRFLQCSKRYFPYRISTESYTHDNRLLQRLERKEKDEDSESVFTLYYFPPRFLGVSQKKTPNEPHDGVLLLCLSLSLFE